MYIKYYDLSFALYHLKSELVSNCFSGQISKRTLTLGPPRKYRSYLRYYIKEISTYVLVRLKKK